MNCSKFKLDNIITKDKLNKYLKHGWEALSTEFKKKKSAKEGEIDQNIFKGLNPSEKKTAMKILGVLREHIVDQEFICAQDDDSKGKNEYNAAGSTNITSDYDLTVSGPQANELMWKMFKSFLRHFKNALPFAFDSNIYSSPLFIHKTKGETGTDINPRKKETHFPRVNYGDRYFTLIAETHEQIQEELTWACIKLLEGGVDKEFTKLTEILTKSKAKKKELDDKCDSVKKEKEYKDEKQKYKMDNESEKIFKNYYLQWKSQQPIEQYIYHGGKLTLNNDINIFSYSNKVNYFASEAYYTSSAINSIVVELQLGNKLDYPDKKSCIYAKIIAAIEQIGDMTNHISHANVDTKDPNSFKKIAVKFSKYIYRFWYLMGFLDEDYRKKAQDINEKIIPLRATYAVDGIEKTTWKLIGMDNYHNNNTEKGKKDWVNGLRKEFLQIIEGFLDEKKINELSGLDRGSKQLKRRVTAPPGMGRKKTRRRKKRSKKKKRKKTKRKN